MMSATPIDFSPTLIARQRLERVWLGWVGLYGVTSFAGALLLSRLTTIDPWCWLGPTAGIMLYQLWLLRRGLDDNTVAAGELDPRLGVGTTVTLLRGLAIAAVGGFVAAPPPTGALEWVPGLLYAGVGLGDRLDGFLARATGHVTRLGTRLDTELDALGLLVAPLYGVVSGRLPIWYLGLSSAYYLFNGGLALRRWRGLPVRAESLRPSAHARAFAGMQMGMVAIALLPILSAELTRLAASLFMVPVLAGFGRDWLVATGRVEPTSLRYTHAIQRLITLTRGLLPVTTRFLLLLAAGWLIIGTRGPDTILLVLLLLVILGVAARLASLGLVFWVGLSPLAPFSLALLSGGLLVILLGSGWLSLLQPEEPWLFPARCSAPR